MTALTRVEEIAAMVAADDEWHYAERAKLAAALRWMRDRGHERTRETEAGTRGYAYRWQLGMGSITFIPEAHGDPVIYAGQQVLTPESVTQGIDLLVALGHLPPWMSSQVQAAIAAAGWATGATEWALRCARPGHAEHGQIFSTGSEERLRAYAAEDTNCFELVSRQIGPWVVAS